MVLTTPYGPARVNELERTYDEELLAALLGEWTVLDRCTILRSGEQTWIPRDPRGESPGDGGKQGVVMVVAAPGHRE
jgi:hypothetical protein